MSEETPASAYSCSWTVVTVLKRRLWKQVMSNDILKCQREKQSAFKLHNIQERHLKGVPATLASTFPTMLHQVCSVCQAGTHSTPLLLKVMYTEDYNEPVEFR